MNFNITKKNKKKARKNRIRKEKKWIIPRVVTTVLCIVSIVSFCVGIFVISNNDYEKLQIFGIIFVVTFIIAIILSTVVKILLLIGYKTALMKNYGWMRMRYITFSKWHLRQD